LLARRLGVPSDADSDAVIVLVALVCLLVGLCAGIVIGGRAGWLALVVAGRVISAQRPGPAAELRRVA